MGLPNKSSKMAPVRCTSGGGVRIRLVRQPHDADKYSLIKRLILITTFICSLDSLPYC